MLVSRLLLLLCWSWSSNGFALDRVEDLLPRPGQSLDIWNGDLTKKIGRSRAEIEQGVELYTLQNDNLPTLHFLMHEQRFSIPGVAATGKPEKFDDQGVIRYVYRGSQMAGAIEKFALVELVKIDDGRCQLSWKLSVINRGEKIRDQQGAVAYDCKGDVKTKGQRQEAMQLLPGQTYLKR